MTARVYRRTKLNSRAEALAQLPTLNGVMRGAIKSAIKKNLRGLDFEQKRAECNGSDAGKPNTYSSPPGPRLFRGRAGVTSTDRSVAVPVGSCQSGLVTGSELEAIGVTGFEPVAAAEGGHLRRIDRILAIAEGCLELLREDRRTGPSS